MNGVLIDNFFGSVAAIGVRIPIPIKERRPGSYKTTRLRKSCGTATGDLMNLSRTAGGLMVYRADEVSMALSSLLKLWAMTKNARLEAALFAAGDWY